MFRSKLEHFEIEVLKSILDLLCYASEIFAKDPLKIGTESNSHDIQPVFKKVGKAHSY